MRLFAKSEILLDLVPNRGDFLVPLDLIFRKPGIYLVLPHDSVTNAVHVQEVPIGLAAVSLGRRKHLEEALSLEGCWPPHRRSNWCHARRLWKPRRTIRDRFLR